MSYYREILIIFVDFSLINQFYNYFILLVYGDRVDGYMIGLVRQCLFIQILIIKEVFFSVVIFLMVYYNRNLIDLFVRCDMVLYVNDLLNDIEIDLVVKYFVEDNYERDNFENVVLLLLGFEWYVLDILEFYEIIDLKYFKYF